MKRLKYLLLFSFALFTGQLHGDIIITKPTPAKICVRIKNLHEFPDIAVIGVNNCLAFSNSNIAYRVDSGSCLKFNQTCSLSLYALKTDYFNRIDLDKIDWEKDKNVQKLNLTVKAQSFSTSQFRSLEIDFNLACRHDTVFYLYKAKTTYQYKNSRPDLVQHFKDETEDPLKPISVSIKHETKHFF